MVVYRTRLIIIQKKEEHAERSVDRQTVQTTQSLQQNFWVVSTTKNLPPKTLMVIHKINQNRRFERDLLMEDSSH